jgi:hypothetical protein
VPLVVTSAKRLSALPDVPTMIEAGYPAVEALSWGGLFAPARTPQPIVKRLSDELGLVMKSAEVKAALDTVASFPTDMPHEAFAPYVAREAGKWGGRRPQVGRESGVTAQDRKARVHVRRHLKGEHKGPASGPPMPFAQRCSPYGPSSLGTRRQRIGRPRPRSTARLRMGKACVARSHNGSLVITAGASYCVEAAKAFEREHRFEIRLARVNSRAASASPLRPKQRVPAVGRGVTNAWWEGRADLIGPQPLAPRHPRIKIQRPKADHQPGIERAWRRHAHGLVRPSRIWSTRPKRFTRRADRTAQHKASLPTQIPNHCLLPTAQNRTNFCSRRLAWSTRTA